MVKIKCWRSKCFFNSAKVLPTTNFTFSAWPLISTADEVQGLSCFWLNIQHYLTEIIFTNCENTLTCISHTENNKYHMMRILDLINTLLMLSEPTHSTIKSTFLSHALHMYGEYRSTNTYFSHNKVFCTATHIRNTLRMFKNLLHKLHSTVMLKGCKHHYMFNPIYELLCLNCLWRD